MNELFNKWRGERWLSAAALWAVIGAWAAAGVWGWLQNAAGIMALILVALTIGAQVFAARAIKNLMYAQGAPRKLALGGLGVACLTFTAYSGHQGVVTSENARWAAYEAWEARQAEAAAIDARIDAVPKVPLSDEQGRAIGPIRTAELGRQRADEIARLEAKRPSVGMIPVARPAPRMDERLMLLFTALVEALELLGFFALSTGATVGASLGQVFGFNAGRELARKRWDMVNAATA